MAKIKAEYAKDKMVLLTYSNGEVIGGVVVPETWDITEEVLRALREHKDLERAELLYDCSLGAFDNTAEARVRMYREDFEEGGEIGVLCLEWLYLYRQEPLLKKGDKARVCGSDSPYWGAQVELLEIEERHEVRVRFLDVDTTSKEDEEWVWVELSDLEPFE